MVYLRRFDFNQGREASILAGQNLIPLYNQLGTQNLLNYMQNSHGFNVFAELSAAPQLLPASGITYGYDISNIVTETTAATNYFQYINFSGVAGPNALNGIKTSQHHAVASPTTRSTIPLIRRAAGASSSRSAFRRQRPGRQREHDPADASTSSTSIRRRCTRRTSWRSTLMASIISGYGGKDVPPFSRTFIGGEQDVRGFEIWGITPIAFIASSAHGHRAELRWLRAHAEDGQRRRADIGCR